jgi:hypothetical protein
VNEARNGDYARRHRNPEPRGPLEPAPSPTGPRALPPMTPTDHTPDETPRPDARTTPAPNDPDYNEALHGIDWGADFGSDAAPGSKGKKAFGAGPASDGDDTRRAGRGGADTFERGPE